MVDAGRSCAIRELYFPHELLREFRRVLQTLVREDGVFVSDRKVIKLTACCARTRGSSTAARSSAETCARCRYLGETRDEIDLLERRKVPRPRSGW